MTKLRETATEKVRAGFEHAMKQVQAGPSGTVQIDIGAWNFLFALAQQNVMRIESEQRKLDLDNSH